MNWTKTWQQYKTDRITVLIVIFFILCEEQRILVSYWWAEGCSDALINGEVEPCPSVCLTHPRWAQQRGHSNDEMEQKNYFIELCPHCMFLWIPLSLPFFFFVLAQNQYIALFKTTLLSVTVTIPASWSFIARETNLYDNSCNIAYWVMD